MPLPKIVVTAALMAANMALTMTRKIEGPRLDDLSVTVADYGTPLPMVWGKRRIDGLPIIWAEPLTEIRRESKTKGGKYNDYTYFGTWAVALAGHEIDALSRLWFDKHLVLDFSGAGPVTPFPIGTTSSPNKKGGTRFISSDLNDHYSLYLGTEDQEVDERIAATEGEDNATAYRGIAYIVFKDVPLEKFGNRIPQVTGEIIRNATASWPVEAIDAPVDTGLRGIAFSNDWNRLAHKASGNQPRIIDMSSRSVILEGDQGSLSIDYEAWAMEADGSILTMESSGGGNDKLFRANPDLHGFQEVQTFADGQDFITVVYDGNGADYWGTRAYSIFTRGYFNGTRLNLASDYGISGLKSGGYAKDSYGDVWAFCFDVGGSNKAYFIRMVDLGQRGGPSFVEVDVGFSGGGTDINPMQYTAMTHYKDDTVDHFIFPWGDYLVAADVETGAVNYVSVFGINNDLIGSQLRWVPEGATTGWFSGLSFVREVSLRDLSIIRTFSTGSWPWAETATTAVIYHPVLHALIGFNSSTDEIYFYYLDRVDSDGMTLGDIAASVAVDVGVDDYDFTTLDQAIKGWSATPGQGSSILEPLFDAYDSDIRPHGFEVEGIKRGGAASVTLDTEDYIAGEDRYRIRVRQASELPRALTYNFADANADQQPNNVRSDRPLDSSDAREERTIDMSTLAGTPTEIRGLADRHFRRIWNSRREAELGLTFQELALEPGDLRTLDFDSDEMDARLVRMIVKSDDTIATEWVYDDPRLNAIGPAVGADADGHRPSVILTATPSKGFMFDIPLIRDADENSNPVIQMGAGPYVASWPGADIYQEIGGEYTTSVHAVPTGRAATWGYAKDALADANPWLWDRGNSVNINVINGTLTSTTEAEINANPALNLVYLGGELLNFTTATLEGDGTYTLTGLKRGRRGTEWACSAHAVADEFVLVDNLDAETFDLSDVGTDLSFKAITNGATATSGFPVGVSFTGASLKPYAPAHVEAVKESNGDWTIYGVRRTRVGGAWTSGTTIPLSENSEEYEIALDDGSTQVTKTTASLPYTWDVATQTSDMGAEVTAGNLDGTVYQMSDAVGRGYGTAFSA